MLMLLIITLKQAMLKKDMYIHQLTFQKTQLHMQELLQQIVYRLKQTELISLI